MRLVALVVRRRPGHAKKLHRRKNNEKADVTHAHYPRTRKRGSVECTPLSQIRRRRATYGTWLGGQGSDVAGTQESFQTDAACRRSSTHRVCINGAPQTLPNSRPGHRKQAVTLPKYFTNASRSATLTCVSPQYSALPAHKHIAPPPPPRLVSRSAPTPALRLPIPITLHIQKHEPHLSPSD